MCKRSSFASSPPYVPHCLTLVQFLDSVLSSLGGTGSPQPSISQPPPAPVTSAKQSAPAAKREPGLTGTASGAKRKAEDQLPRAPRPANSAPSTSNKPVPPKAVANSAPKRDSPKPIVRNGTSNTSRLINTSTQKVAAPKPTPSKPVSAKPILKKEAAPAKAPPKGSFADLMAQAKAKQATNPTPVGGFKNQHVEREKVSWVEHKRRLAEAKREARGKSAGRPYKPSPSHKPVKASRKSTSPDVSSYKGTAKPAPKAPEVPEYRGTAGLASNRKHNDRRTNGKRRMNEYLGTDEEDEGDYGGYEDYYSDQSSDMEAGFDDVEDEDAAALKSARKEDEEEQRMEEAAKRAKLERQKKLAALASRKR